MGGFMISKIKLSLSRINYKLFAALLVLGLVPTIYTTVRVFFLGQLPGEYSFSIAGQLSWVNLLYEIMNEAIILPLFYFIGKVKDDKDEFSNRVRTGMLISLGVYAVLSAVVLIFAEPMLKLMATDASIIEASASYIRIESIANIFSILTQFALVALVTVNKSNKRELREDRENVCDTLNAYVGCGCFDDTRIGRHELQQRFCEDQHHGRKNSIYAKRDQHASSCAV